MVKTRNSRTWATLALRTATVVVPLAAASPAVASPVYAYSQSLAIPGATTFSGYDLSVFDAATQLYYLSDRSNNGVDVFSAKTNSYVERLGAGLFAGSQGGNNDIAGPNGIYLSNTASGKILLAGNGPSNFVSFNLDSTGLNLTSAPRVTSTVTGSTPPTPNRVDGVAYAPGANTILAANNAATPGFVTLIDNGTGKVLRTIILDGTGGYPNVGGNGVESTLYNTARNSYFIAIPTLSVDSSDNPADAGGVIELDATNGNLLHTYSLNALGLSGPCSPTGLSQGSGASMLIACSDPTAGHSVVLDPTGNGSIALVNGISGGDQTSYDPANNTYFEAARYQTGGPVLGIIDGSTLAVQLIAAGNNDHSIAVDPVSGEAFLATGPTTAFPGCTAGCIAVLTPVPEPGTIAIIGAALAGLGVLRRRRRR